MTVADIFRQANEQLRDLYPEEEIKAMVFVLLQHFAGLSKTQIYTNPQLSIFHFPFSIFHSLNQLSTGRPLQYVLGETEFSGLVFEVNENVLIPRPETEELVHWAVDELKSFAAPRVLDLCTGSACIAVSVAAALPSAQVSACDISLPALDVARRNAARNKVNIDFFECDILSDELQVTSYKNPVTRHSSLVTSPVDCILSNPPYVRNSEKLLMRRNVLDFEPPIALFVEDSDPLVFYRAIAGIACKHLSPDGFVMVEINEALADETAQVFKNEGFSQIEFRKDIFDKDRILKISY